MPGRLAVGQLTVDSLQLTVSEGCASLLAVGQLTVSEGYASLLAVGQLTVDS